MAVRRPVTSRSTITSSICERPVWSHRIRLLVPAALPSTTTSVGEVARVSITAGLLDRTRVMGVCTLTTTDFPTRMWSACPSDGAGTCWGGVGAATGAGACACAGATVGVSEVAGTCCAAPYNPTGSSARTTTRPVILRAMELFIFRPHRFREPASAESCLILPGVRISLQSAWSPGSLPECKPVWKPLLLSWALSCRGQVEVQAFLRPVDPTAWDEDQRWFDRRRCATQTEWCLASLPIAALANPPDLPTGSRR